MASSKKSTNVVPIYQQNKTIYKSNELIESSYSLTTAQHRLLYLAMAQLKEIILDKNMNIEQVEDAIENLKFPMIYIDVIDYKKVFKINSNSLYKDLVKISKDLYNEEILYINEKGNIGTKRWVITCEYDEERKGVAMEFHPRLIRDLLVFKSEFTRMIFDEFADKLKGKHSFRIYELCKQYCKLTRRDFYIEDLRFKLRLKDDEYKGYNSLKNQVLKTAIKEINQNTDLELTLEEVEKNKKTRRVEKIRFYIKTKSEQRQLNLFDEQDISITRLEEDRNIVTKISDIIGQEITAETAQKILTESLRVIDDKKLKLGVIDYISSKVKICNNYVKSTKKGVDNYIGLLIRAIEKDWQDSYVSGLRFDNFKGRTIDYDELERKLLGWD